MTAREDLPEPVALVNVAHKGHTWGVWLETAGRMTDRAAFIGSHGGAAAVVYATDLADAYGCAVVYH